MTPLQEEVLKSAVERDRATVVVAGATVKERVKWLETFMRWIPPSDDTLALLDPTKLIKVPKGAEWYRPGLKDLSMALKSALQMDLDAMVISEVQEILWGDVLTLIETDHQALISSDRSDARIFLGDFLSTLVKKLSNEAPPSPDLEVKILQGIIRRPLLLLNIKDSQSLLEFFRVEIKEGKIIFSNV